MTEGVPSHLSPSGRYRANTVSVAVRPSSSQVRVLSVNTEVHDVPRTPIVWPVCSDSTQGDEYIFTVIEVASVVGQSIMP